MDILVSTTEVNNLLGRSYSKVRLSHEDIKALLAKLDIAPVGAGPSGRPVYFKSAILEKKDEINALIREEARKSAVPPMPAAPVSAPADGDGFVASIDEADLQRAVSLAMRDGIGSIQRYIDTSFAQFDEKLDQIHKCAQQAVRVAGEANNGGKAALDAISRLTSAMSESVKRIETHAAAVMAESARSLDSMLNHVGSEMNTIRSNTSELLRRAH